MNFNLGNIYKAEIERITTQLRTKKSVHDLSKILTDIEDRYKDLMFNLREATGNGNYKDVGVWSVSEINDFILRKNRQINQVKNGKRNKN